MSQPDLLTQLRDARPIAPDELREHVRRIAEGAPPERRRITWRRSFAVGVPVVAAAVAAAALLPRGSGPAPRSVATTTVAAEAPAALSPTVQGKAPPAFGSAATSTSGSPSPLPATSPNRPVRYSATLELRVADGQAVSDATRRAVAIARALGGFPKTLDVDTSGKAGYATIVLRIPKQNVQKAVTRLSALGTIAAENVSIQDLGAQVDETTRKLARLQQQLAAWQAKYQTTETEKHVAALTAQIAKLKRGKAATLRTASYATVSLQLTTRQAPVVRRHHTRGPLHGLGVAFHWAWIGAVYFLAFAVPVALLAALVWLAGRGVRRRREDSLLRRS
jgi:Domain of unknown function (DUF4349)